MTLDEARQHIGEKVIYSGGALLEEGVITSVTDHYVFVRYGDNYGAKATHPQMLTLLWGGDSWLPR